MDRLLFAFIYDSYCAMDEKNKLMRQVNRHGDLFGMGTILPNWIQMIYVTGMEQIRGFFWKAQQMISLCAIADYSLHF